MLRKYSKIVTVSLSNSSGELSKLGAFCGGAFRSTFFLKNTMEIGFVLSTVGKGEVDSEHKITVCGENEQDTDAH
jgi:hypothetical protein